MTKDKQRTKDSSLVRAHLAGEGTVISKGDVNKKQDHKLGSLGLAEGSVSIYISTVFPALFRFN